MGKLIEEMTKAGVLLATEGCQPSAQGARVRRLKVAGDGESEIRPLFEPCDFPEEAAREAVTRKEMQRNAAKR
jgi:hypothetical protein